MTTAARIDELRKKFEENPRRYFAPLANELRKAGELSQAIALGTDRKATLYAHLYQGMLSRERGRYVDAEQSFRTALTLGPNLLQAWYELGETFWRSGRRVEAMTAWKTGAEANKFSPWGKRCAEMLDVVEQGGTPPRDG